MTFVLSVRTEVDRSEQIKETFYTEFKYIKMGTSLTILEKTLDQFMGGKTRGIERKMSRLDYVGLTRSIFHI